jgi:farnesol dehydrogenase
MTGRGYILGGDNATQDRLFAVLERLTGIRPPRFAVPYAAAEAMGLANRLLAALTGIAPVLTEGVVSTFRHEWAYSSERAVREIGYRVTPIEEGLRVTVEDLRNAPGGAGVGGM